jgi:hypothetical protein
MAKQAIKLRQPKSALPSLRDRVRELVKDIFESDPQEARAALAEWQDLLDQKLDQEAETRRPPSIPQGVVRMQYDAKGYGPCHCQTFTELLK